MVVLPWVTPVESVGIRMIYVEEPEAHLFPEAQSRLVELFARMVNQAAGHTQMVLTTHSPYVLSKINNLLKAGALGAQSEERSGVRLETIVPKGAWLAPKSVQAYAIRDRCVLPIMDSESGLIDADYLDAISGAIAKQFSELLHYEHVS